MATPVPFLLTTPATAPSRSVTMKLNAKFKTFKHLVYPFPGSLPGSGAVCAPVDRSFESDDKVAPDFSIKRPNGIPGSPMARPL